MHIETYREYVALAESLNFTRTAKDLYMSQSVLSKHIGQLEIEIGAQLLIRSQHHVELTEAGRVLLERMKQILADYDSTLEDVRAAQGQSKPIKFGYLLGASRGFLQAAYREFIERHPEALVQFSMMEGAEAIDALLNGRIDLALIHTCEPLMRKSMKVKHLFDEPFAIMVLRNHPLAQGSLVSLEELRPYTIYIMDPKSSPQFGRYLTQTLAGYGFEEPQHLHVPDINSLAIGFADVAGGVALVPWHLRFMYANDDFAFVPFDQTYFNTQVVLAWDESRATPLLLDFAKLISYICRKSMA